MTRFEIINNIKAKNPDLTLKDVERIVDFLFDTIINHIADGGRVEFRNFGTFSGKLRNERIGHNPKTGEKVHVPAKVVPFFKAGKLLLERLNGVKIK